MSSQGRNRIKDFFLDQDQDGARPQCGCGHPECAAMQAILDAGGEVPCPEEGCEAMLTSETWMEHVLEEHFESFAHSLVNFLVRQGIAHPGGQREAGQPVVVHVMVVGE